MADASSMFDRLAKGREKGRRDDETPPTAPPEETVQEAPPEPQRRRRKPMGKRSDPNYIQVGVYIPKELNKKVKRELVDSERDFSDLVRDLLDDWVNQSSS